MNFGIRGWDRLSVGVAAATLAALSFVLVQLVWVPIPAMLDYVNHLSRMYLLSGAPSPVYVVRFRLYTDLAMDLLVPALAPLMGVQAAAKLFLAISQVLVVTGAMALEWTVKRRQRLGGPGALLILFGLPFAWGLMNFMFGLGVVAWGFTFWIALRERPAALRWLVHAALVGLIFVSHLFDLGVYGLTIGLYELSRLERRPSAWSLVKLGVFMASPVVLALATASAVVGGGVGQPVFHWDAFGLKFGWLLVFMNVYDPALSMLTTAALFGVLVAMVATRRLGLSRSGVWIASGYAVTYVLLPRMMFDTQFQDVRMLTAAGMILPAFMTTRLSAGFWRRVPVGVVASVIALNYAFVAQAWASDQRDYREVKASFPLLASGATVMVGVEDQADQLMYGPLFYAPTLAAPARGVFVSSLYSLRGMQPVEPRASVQRLAAYETSDYKPPRLSVLAAAANGGSGGSVALRRWVRDYHYLYVIGPPGANPSPRHLTRLAKGRMFTLYGVVA